MNKQRVLLTPMYQKVSFPSQLASSAYSTKKSFLQTLEYSYCVKREFFFPQYTEFQTNWLNQTVRGTL